MDGMDGTTLCPSCSARMWVPKRGKEQRCVCGCVFVAEASKPFVTAKDKLKAQGATTSGRGPQPVDRPAPAKPKRTRKAGG